MGLKTWVRRQRGLLGVGVRQTLARTTQTARKRIRLNVLGVAIAIALLLVVTGIGLGLVTGTTVYDDDVDYWVVPESDGERSPLLATDNPQFGDVHSVHEEFTGYDEVDATTPVLFEVTPVEHGETREYVLVIGVINTPELGSVAGVDATALTRDDPFYTADGSTGEWTGDVVASQGTATLLDLSENDDLRIAGNESFAVTAIDDDSDGTGMLADTPIVLVQLSELQAVTGADSNDQADQILVQTSSPAVADSLEDAYPQSTVQSRGEMVATQAFDSDLPLALGLTAVIVAITIGTLFVITTTGLEVAADKRQLATLSAIGVPIRSQVVTIAVRTVTTTVIGGIIGALVGLIGIWGINRAGAQLLDSGSIALFHPLLFLYGVAVALLIGLLSVPYIVLVTKRVGGGVTW